MNKENNKSAARLRRSAIAERIRLREEWLALKGTDDVQCIANVRDKRRNVLKKVSDNVKVDNRRMHEIGEQKKIGPKIGMENARFARAMAANEVLRGVVALVDMGAESRALALRAALAALGATVAPTFSPLVTHLVWSQGGCRETRARARALACQLVSPLWVEGCAAGGRRLPEGAFPAAARASDLPSPRTLRWMLHKADMEGIPLADLLSDSGEQRTERPRLRISSETERGSSTDATPNTSRDKPDVETRVNTAPRRALPATSASPLPAKSRRKLFTQKEAELSRSSNETDEDRTPARPKQLTQRERRDLARAERMARRILTAGANAHAKAHANAHAHANAATDAHAYRFVLTGMSRSERIAAHRAIRTLNGRIQKEVNRKTTHVLLGSCREDSLEISPGKNLNSANMTNKNNNVTNREPNENEVVYGDRSKIITDTVEKSNMTCLESLASKLSVASTPKKAPNTTMHTHNIAQTDTLAGKSKMASTSHSNMAAKLDARGKTASRRDRTLNSLLGAARGCRVLLGHWATDSAAAGRWLHHCGYEVPHLRKLAQRARVERNALGRTRSEYAYDVFDGMRVRVSPRAGQRAAALQLLRLCGAAVRDGGQQGGGNMPNDSRVQDGGKMPNDSRMQDGDITQDGDGMQDGGKTQRGDAIERGGVPQNGGQQRRLIQNGRSVATEGEIVVGVEEGQVASKWVFDSVASARARNVRRYINRSYPESSTFCDEL